MDNTPVCLFVFKRVDTFSEVIKSLKRNSESCDTPLYIFSDAARNSKDKFAVDEVRSFARSISGFASVEIIEQKENLGLARSIINGVTQILKKYDQIIVLEDDLVVSDNFLAYMNQCLNKYQKDTRICSISGYSSQRIGKLEAPHDVFFGLRSSSWGWGTWADRWQKIDWNVSQISILKKSSARAQFQRGGADLVRMLKRQQRGEIDSWAIRFSFFQFITRSYDVVPRISKVENIGFSLDATNTSGMSDRFVTKTDNSGRKIFRLPDEPFEDEEFLQAFRVPFSIRERLKFKIVMYARAVFNRTIGRLI